MEEEKVEEGGRKRDVAQLSYNSAISRALLNTAVRAGAGVQATWKEGVKRTCMPRGHQCSGFGLQLRPLVAIGRGDAGHVV